MNLSQADNGSGLLNAISKIEEDRVETEGLQSQAVRYGRLQSSGAYMGYVQRAQAGGRKDVQMRTQRDPELFLVADLNGSVIGVVMGAWDGRRAWCHNYGVDPQFRGQGVGAALIQELENKVKEKGLPRLNVLVRHGDTATQGLFEACGFHKEDWDVLEWNTP